MLSVEEKWVPSMACPYIFSIKYFASMLCEPMELGLCYYETFFYICLIYIIVFFSRSYDYDHSLLY